MLIVAVMTVMLSAGSADAAAAPAPAPAADRKDDWKTDPDRIICKREYTVGSHRPEKICKSKHEWDLLTEQTRDLLRDGGVQEIMGPGIPGGKGDRPVPH